MTDKIRWGILGTGKIARKFAAGLAAVPDAALVAVGSRTQDSADRFAGLFRVPHCHGSYEALAADPDVDAVYIATLHPFHAANSLFCLNAGKAVLCEKPFTMNAREAADVIRTARGRKLFLMEAMWTRFLPVVARVREWLRAGAIGEVLMLTADFGFRAEFDRRSRVFDPALGGGALLDVGIYPISFASMVFGGPPDRIASLAHLGQTGVDEEAGIVLGYSGGRLAVLHTAVRVNTPGEACIMGTAGMIRIPARFWCATTVSLLAGGNEERIEIPLDGNGYNYEAAEVGRCLREGRLESDVMPLDESLSIMQTLDRIREQWGLCYPGETMAQSGERG